MKRNLIIKTCKAIAVSMSLCTILMSNSITAFAAPKEMKDHTVFDAEYYAERYPDVVTAYGTDEVALFQHYTNYGKAENRAAVKTPSISTFDPVYYAEKNPDVVAVYGSGNNNLYQHYLQYGKNEGRKPTATATITNPTETASAETSQTSPATPEKVKPEETTPAKEETPKTISDEDAQGIFLAYINNVDNMLLGSLPAGAFEFFDTNGDSTIDQPESAKLIMWLIDKYNDSDKGNIILSEQIAVGRALHNGTFETPSSLYFVQ